MTAPVTRYEARERDGAWGVWNRRLARWEGLDDGTEHGQQIMSELDTEFLAGDLAGQDQEQEAP
jgi:hypothetical protein